MIRSHHIKTFICIGIDIAVVCHHIAQIFGIGSLDLTELNDHLVDSQGTLSLGRQIVIIARIADDDSLSCTLVISGTFQA